MFTVLKQAIAVLEDKKPSFGGIRIEVRMRVPNAGNLATRTAIKELTQALGVNPNVHRITRKATLKRAKQLVKIIEDEGLARGE